MYLQTTRNKHQKARLHSRREAVVPHLTPAHRIASRNFVEEHANFDIYEWSQVLFPDESRFCFYSNDGRVSIDFWIQMEQK